MTRFVVTGSRRVIGGTRVSGAKNAALPILAASLLADCDIALYDCPHLRDVDNMLLILSELGVRHHWRGDALIVDPLGADGYELPQGLSKEIRSSIFMLGPLLARFGRAKCTFPGGCEIGNRPIDLHLKGLSMLGVKIREHCGLIDCEGFDMRGADIHLDYPSVGATENIIMAAVNAKGVTTVGNAAREPEIEDLQEFLNKLGYSVSGAGTSTVTVRGGRQSKCRKPVEHRIIPDRIVAGTLLCAAAITGGELELTNVIPLHIGSVASKLREAGCAVREERAANDELFGRGRMYIKAPPRLNEIDLIETLPYPGFPTDMQAQFFALAAVSKGTSVIVENVFENRFKHGAELQRMGTIFTQKDRTIIIRGVESLNGASVTARDLRGGAALTLAGLRATGETIVYGAEHIDRGYERLDETLTALGAPVKREEL